MCIAPSRQSGGSSQDNEMCQHPEDQVYLKTRFTPAKCDGKGIIVKAVIIQHGGG